MNICTARGGWSAKYLTVLILFSVVASALPASFFVAEAATSDVHVGPTPVTLTSAVARHDSAGVDASGYENLKLAFEYNAEAIDASNGGDTFVYGWRVGGVDTQLGVIVGKNESSSPGSATDETGTVLIALPAGAETIGLTVYFQMKGTSIAEDSVVVSNYKITGDDTETEDDEDPIPVDTGKKVDICHFDGEEFSFINVSVHSIGNAHGASGVNDGDIIPAFDGYGGQNLTTEYGNLTGAELLVAECVPPTRELTVTVSATKIICTDEEDLPNWGAGGPDITAATAADWVATHKSCRVVPDWEFQWGNQDAPDTADGFIGAAAGYTTFAAPTNMSGVTTAVIPLTGVSSLHVREVQQAGYIPFTHGAYPDNSDDVSAEFYCGSDVVNYDNWDFITNPQADTTYHCVAWNAPVDEPVTPECKLGSNLLANGSFENPEVLNDSWDVYPSGTTGLEWLVSWVAAFVGAPTTAKLELQENYLSWDASHGDQYAELDADWGSADGEQASVKIAQTIATEIGATYELRYDFSARPSTGVADNALLLSIGGVSEPLLTLDGTSETNASWTTYTKSFTAGSVATEIAFADAGTPNSMGTFLDNAVLCKTADAPNVPAVTVHAYKVVCDTEADLPSGAMMKPITDATAQAWVDQSDGACRLASGWNFEWGAAGAGDGGLSTIGHVAPYTTFGPTDSVGFTSTVVPLANLGGRIEAREVLAAGYIPFGADLRAEFYCANDAAGYDNWDWINNPVDGGVYTCVAFNAPEPPTTGTLAITKYECPADTAVVRSQNGVGGTVPSSCVLQTGASFGYVHGEQTDAAGPYPELSAPLIDAGETVGGLLSVPNLDPSGRYLVVETDSVGNKLAANDILGLYCTGDGDTSATNDNQELTFIEAGKTSHCVAYNKMAPAPQCSLTLASDDGTLVVENNDFATSTYAGNDRWTALIPDATWIWDTFYVQDPEADTTRTFTETFTVDAPTSAVIDIAADNSYALFINDILVLDRTNENNYQSHTQYATSVLPYLNATGSNTLRIEVTNWGVGGSNKLNNPAGLLYKLVISGAARCDVTTEPDETVVTPDEDVATTTPTSTPPVVIIPPVTVPTTTDPITVTPTTTDSVTVPVTPLNRRNNSGGGTRVTARAPLGQVLGAASSTPMCGRYLDDYLRVGNAASTTQVTKLQVFLNAVGQTTPITGIFDAATDASVRAFQLAHQSEVLTPWYSAGIVPHELPTGWVYQLTRWKINNIVCPGSEAYPTLN